MTRDERALRLHALALALLRSSGTSIALRSAHVTVYRRGALTMRYWPTQGLLDVWHGEKVLVIERRDGKLLVAYYKAGIWERDLEEEIEAPIRHNWVQTSSRGRRSSNAAAACKRRHIAIQRA